METPETPAPADIDLGGGSPADPFAEENLPPDPLEGELPPGVEQGSLGGDNPSEEPEEEVVPEEERDASQDEEEEPVGESSTTGDDITSIPPEDEPEEPEPIAAEEPATGVPDSPDGEKSASPEPAAGEPKPEPQKPKRKKSAKKAATPGIRGYVILRVGADPGDWTEAFERPDPDDDEPFVLEARNGTSALRKAYRMLSEADEAEAPQEYLLVPVPKKLWNPKLVKGRVHRQEAISVG